MCYAVRCKQCGKTTWAGCGQHVDDVKRGVPDAQWCAGHTDAPAPEHVEGSSGGFLDRLLRRS